LRRPKACGARILVNQVEHSVLAVVHDYFSLLATSLTPSRFHFQRTRSLGGANRMPAPKPQLQRIATSLTLSAKIAR